MYNIIVSICNTHSYLVFKFSLFHAPEVGVSTLCCVPKFIPNSRGSYHPANLERENYTKFVS